MQKTSGLYNEETFIQWVRHALHNLYDFAELRRNPLVSMLPERMPQSPASLQKVITAAIDWMKPDTGMNPQSNTARSYRILYHRYVEQFSQTEVADDLCISDRQLRRHEVAALEVLAEHLLNELQVAAPPESASGGEPVTPWAKDAPLSGNQELEWLKRSSPCQPVNLQELARTAIETLRPLIESLNVQVEIDAPDRLPDVFVQATSTQQALVIVLSEAIQSAPGGSVALDLYTNALLKRVTLSISAALADDAPSPSAAAQPAPDTLQLAAQLLDISVGTLHRSERAADDPDKELFSVEIHLPASDRIVALFIDDNEDSLRLFKRYLVGTRYAFAGLNDPSQVIAVIEREKPRVIFMDVMMPEIDGWQLLGRLRNHPAAQGIALVICSILPQSQLAYTLGADGFLQKPIKRDHLLTLLDAHTQGAEKKPS